MIIDYNTEVLPIPKLTDRYKLTKEFQLFYNHVQKIYFIRVFAGITYSQFPNAVSNGFNVVKKGTHPSADIGNFEIIFPKGTEIELKKINLYKSQGSNAFRKDTVELFIYHDSFLGVQYKTVPKITINIVGQEAISELTNAPLIKL